jgi:hypothetical protein
MMLIVHQLDVPVVQEQIKSLDSQYAEANVERDIVSGERDGLLQETQDAQASIRKLTAQLEQQTKEASRSLAQVEAVTVALEQPDATDLVRPINELKERLAGLEQSMAAQSADTSKDDATEALRAQHAIELSERDSRIRHMQEDAHAENSRLHRMSKQIGDLETELASLRSKPTSRPASIPSFATPQPSPVKARPSSFAISGPPAVAPPSASIDASLPPSMRHKRQVSLAMLKARMSGPPPSLARQSSKVNTSEPITEVDETAHAALHTTFRSQLSDDAIFWCPGCSQDLITL